MRGYARPAQEERYHIEIPRAHGDSIRHIADGMR